MPKNEIGSKWKELSEEERGPFQERCDGEWSVIWSREATNRVSSLDRSSGNP